MQTATQHEPQNEEMTTQEFFTIFVNKQRLGAFLEGLDYRDRVPDNERARLSAKYAKRCKVWTTKGVAPLIEAFPFIDFRPATEQRKERARQKNIEAFIEEVLQYCESTDETGGLDLDWNAAIKERAETLKG